MSIHMSAHMFIHILIHMSELCMCSRLIDWLALRPHGCLQGQIRSITKMSRLITKMLGSVLAYKVKSAEHCPMAICIHVFPICVALKYG